MLHRSIDYSWFMSIWCPTSSFAFTISVYLVETSVQLMMPRIICFALCFFLAWILAQQRWRKVLIKAFFKNHDFLQENCISKTATPNVWYMSWLEHLTFHWAYDLPLAPCPSDIYRFRSFRAIVSVGSPWCELHFDWWDAERWGFRGTIPETKIISREKFLFVQFFFNAHLVSFLHTTQALKSRLVVKSASSFCIILHTSCKGHMNLRIIAHCLYHTFYYILLYSIAGSCWVPC